MKYPGYLNALRAFEASARHQSFSHAAMELNVTPAAVGQLVRSLEEWLGSPLFHRGVAGRSRLSLTETAARALPDIRAGFERLQRGLARLQEPLQESVLTVTVSPAFAAKWLLPRIETFQATHPQTDVRLDTSLRLADFALQGIDIGVRYGKGVWPDLVAEKLMAEMVFPVCSPEWLSRAGELESPEKLVGKALIHDKSVDTNLGFPSWSEWLRSAGVTSVDSTRGMQVNNSAAVLQAAIAGQGVALGRSVMARDDLEAGRLVRLFPEIDQTAQLAYYIVYREEHVTQPKIAAFRNWLMREADAYRTAGL